MNSERMLDPRRLFDYIEQMRSAGVGAVPELLHIGVAYRQVASAWSNRLNRPIVTVSAKATDEWGDTINVRVTVSRQTFFHGDSVRKPV